MRRDETRYKRVWDAGYAARGQEEGEAFLYLVDAGMQIGAPGFDFSSDMVALRVGGRIHRVSREALSGGLLSYIARSIRRHP